jgi:hypothetical protein
VLFKKRSATFIAATLRFSPPDFQTHDAVVVTQALSARRHLDRAGRRAVNPKIAGPLARKPAFR